MFNTVFSFRLTHHKQDLLHYHTIPFLSIFELIPKPMLRISYQYHNLSHSYFSTEVFEITVQTIFPRILHQLSFIFLIKHFLQILLVLTCLILLKKHLNENENALILHHLSIFIVINFEDYELQIGYAFYDVFRFFGVKNDVACSFITLIKKIIITSLNS